jgi:hypothetical protein
MLAVNLKVIASCAAGRDILAGRAVRPRFFGLG